MAFQAPGESARSRLLARPPAVRMEPQPLHSPSSGSSLSPPWHRPDDADTRYGAVPPRWHREHPSNGTDGTDDNSQASSEDSDDRREEADLDPADVFFRTDIFDAVLVAAFGGVQMNLDGAEELNIHPFVLFLFVVPLASAQFALTFCVGLNMDLNGSIIHNVETEGMEMSIKVLLIVITQMTFFDRMLGALRLLLFSVNPSTWTDIKRIDPDARLDAGSRLWWLHSTPAVSIFPVLTLLMKLLLSYYVTVQSASIILASESVNEAIFDSLAISFILEMDSTVWQFAKTILHLDDFDSFIFRLWPRARRVKAKKESLLRPLLNCRVLHRGSGARRLENFVSFMCMFVIYFRIYMHIVFALKTNIVPAARDVCIQWRWLAGNPRKHPFAAGLFRHAVNLVLSPYRTWWTPADEVAKKAREFCTMEYKDSSQDHWGELIAEFPTATAMVSIILMALLIIPEMFLEKGRLREGLLNCDPEMKDAIDELDKEAVARPVVYVKELAQASAKGNAKRMDRLKVKFEQENDHLRREVEKLQRRLDEAGF